MWQDLFIDFLLELKMAVCAAPWALGPPGDTSILVSRSVRQTNPQVELEVLMESQGRLLRSEATFWSERWLQHLLRDKRRTSQRSSVR